MTTPHSLKLRTPGDVLAAVPYLLGFHPSDSVVVLALRGNRVIFQGRTDAPMPEEIDELAAYLAEVILRQEPTAAILIGYGPERRTGAALAALRAAAESAGVSVVEALRVHDGRYWSLVCGNPRCCPAEGTPYEISTSAVAAAATFAGHAPLADRDALVAALSPVPGPGMEPELARAEERLAGLPGGAGRRRTAARTAVREAIERYAAGGRLDDDEVAWLAQLLTDRAARDDAWQRMLAAPPAVEQVALWRDLMRRVPERYLPAPATLLALASWRAGDGTTASVALERALAVDPGYTLADLVFQALQAGLSPRVMDGLVPQPRRRRRARLRAGVRVG